MSERDIARQRTGLSSDEALANKQHNPKYIEAQKRGKVDYSVIPWEVMPLLAQAMMEGAGKYGRFNFLQDDIEARTYIAAIGRHLFGDPSTGSKGWVNGEDTDEESGLPHTIKIMACCMLIEAAKMHGKLIDNRLETESKTPPSIQAHDDMVAWQERMNAKIPKNTDPRAESDWPGHVAKMQSTKTRLEMMEDLSGINDEIEAKTQPKTK